MDPSDAYIAEWLRFGTSLINDDAAVGPNDARYDTADSIVAESEYSMNTEGKGDLSEVNPTDSYDTGEFKSTTKSMSLEWGDKCDTDPSCDAEEKAECEENDEDLQLGAVWN